VLIAVALVIGVIVGLNLSRFIFKPKVAGTIRVDTSDPTEYYLFLELSNSNDMKKLILQKDYALFKVVAKNYISQD
jgi:hypothetical protein